MATLQPSGGESRQKKPSRRVCEVRVCVTVTTSGSKVLKKKVSGGDLPGITEIILIHKTVFFKLNVFSSEGRDNRLLYSVKNVSSSKQ